MKRAKAILLTVLGSYVLTLAVLASIPMQYQTIVDRNSFGLNPPPPVDTNTPPPTPPANVKVSGFSKMGGELKAYFVITGKDPKDTQYLGLIEGQREGVLEVLKISEEEGEVKVRNSGTEMMLSLKANNMNPAPKLAPGMTPAPGMAPPPPPAPGGVQPGAAPATSSTVFDPSRSTAVVANYTKPAAAPPAPPVPGAPPPIPGQPGVATPSTGNPPSTGMRTIPTRTLRLPPTTSANP